MNDSIFLLMMVSFWYIGIAVMIYSFRRSYKYLKVIESTWVKITGKITKVETHYSKDSQGHLRKSYSPICEFIFNGESIEGISHNSSNDSSLEPGQSAEIMVNPEDYKCFIFNIEGEKRKHFGGFWFMGIFTIGSTAVFFKPVLDVFMGKF